MAPRLGRDGASGLRHPGGPDAAGGRDLFDERLEPIPFDHDTDLIALTVETYTARRAYQIATRFRQRGVPVVMGGYHPTFLPDEALHSPTRWCWATRRSVGAVVADARARTAAGRAIRRRGYPPWWGRGTTGASLRGKRYKAVVPVQYGRGCKFACDFCSIHAFYGTSLRQRPVEEVVEEIRARGGASSNRG